eukprot:764911-Hanusia_phi.AAC.1
MCDEDTIVLISDDELQSNEEHGDVTETKRDMSPSEPGASRAEQPGEEDADRSCWLSGVECSSESDEDPAQGGSERAIPIQDKGREECERAIPIQDKGREECSSNAAGDRPRMTSEEGRTDGSNHPSPCEFDALHAGGVSSDTESATAQPLNASTATHGVVLTPNALPRTGESENQSNNPQSEAKNIPNNRDENDVRDSQSVVKVRNQEGTGCLDKDESEASKANAREGFASDKIEPEHQNQVDLSDNSEEVPTTSSLDGSRPALRSLNDNDAETKQQDKKLSQSNQVVEVRDVEEWARLWRLRDVVKRKAIIQEHLRGKDVSDSLHDELLLGETASLEDRFELSCSFLIACVSIPPDAVQNDVLIAEACEGIRFVVKICEALVPDRDGYVVITERGTSHKSGLFLAFPFESFLTGAGTSGKAANLDLPTDALDAPHGIPIVCDVRSFRQDAEKLYKETKFGIRFQSLPSSTSSAYRQIFVVDEVPGILQGICKGVPFDSVSQNCKENPLQTQTQASGAEKDSCDTLDGRTESEDDIGISGFTIVLFLSSSHKWFQTLNLPSSSLQRFEAPFASFSLLTETPLQEVEEMNSSDYDRACESNLDADVEDHDAHDAKEDGEKATSQLCEDVPADFQCDDPMIENSIASTQRNQDMELTLLRRIHAQFMWSGECVKEEKERKYYSAVMLKDGERVEIGSTVKLIAPQGQPFFLARVLQLWENISDGFKMMRCNWFYLNSEVKQSDVRNPKEVFASEHYDDQYLTTILTPCNIVHKCNIPAFEFASFLHGENNFFYERKFLPLKNMFVRVPPEKEAKKVKPAKPPAAEPKATKRCLSSVEKPAEDDRNGGNQQILPLKRILDTPLEPPSSSKHARLPSHQQPPTAPPQPQASDCLFLAPGADLISWQQPKSSEQLQYRGVERNEDGTFRAVAHIKGSKVSYAPFKSSKMAARAYDLMVCKETGPNTPSLNFNHDHAATLELQEVTEHPLPHHSLLVLLVLARASGRKLSSVKATLNNQPFLRAPSLAKARSNEVGQFRQAHSSQVAGGQMRARAAKL